jgi:N-acyl-D-aspartate/D-glutamate deacylase
MRKAQRGAIELAINMPELGAVSQDGLELISRLVHDSERPVTYIPLINKPEDPLSYLSATEQLGSLLDWRRCVPQITARPLTVQFGLRAPFPMGSLKAFHRVIDRPLEEQMAIYRDPGFRQQVREAMAGQSVFSGFFERIRPLDAANPKVQRIVSGGKSVAEVARLENVDALDAWFDMAIEDNLETVFNFQAANFEPEGVRNLLRDGRFMVGLSDGGAHVTQLCDAGYATYLLGHWVREVPTLSLEEAIQNLTAKPADFFGIPRRGRLLPGNHADLVIFDPETVHAEAPEFVADLPGNRRRLVARARGVMATIVGGQVLYRDGEYQGGLPGTVLRSTDV